MKLFKTIDEKFAEIGFVKIEEDKYGAIYERLECPDIQFYTQVLHLAHKASGQHIVQSYDKDLTDEKKIGNTCIGLTMYEMKLCMKKMREMGWKPCKRKNGEY